MILKCKYSLPVFLGLLILSVTAIPNVAMAQKKTKKKKKGDEVAKRLAAAQEISSESGRPILAVVSNLDTT